VRAIIESIQCHAADGIAVEALAADPYAHGEPAGSAPPSAISGPQANSAHKATVQGADSRINNTVEIAQRMNQELGINLESTTAGWKRELDRLEGDLARPRLRYSDLNRFRDELLRVRSAVQEVPKASGTLFPR
jgi:potassium efflux system protein